MIQIKIGEEYLDIPDNLSIPFEFMTNALQFDKIDGARSFEFQIKNTPRNYRLTGFEKLTNILGELYINNTSYSFVDITVKNTIAKEISLSLNFDLLLFFKKIENIYLDEIFPDYELTIEVSNLNTIVNQYYPETNIYAPTISFGQLTIDDLLNAYVSNSYIVDNLKKFIRPFFALGFVIEKILNYGGYYLNESVFKTDDFLKKLFVIYIYNQIPSAMNMNFSNSLPHITLDFFIKSVIKIFGIRFTFSNNTANILFLNKLYFNSSEAKCFLSDIAISKINAPYKRVSYSYINATEMNGLQYSFANEGEDLDISFKYSCYTSRLSNNELGYDTMWVYDIALEELAFGIYKYENNRPTALYSDILSLENNSSHFFYSYLLKAIQMRNTFLKRIEATIVFNKQFLIELQNINSISYDNREYLIERIAGNLTGLEYEQMKLTAYLIE